MHLGVGDRDDGARIRNLSLCPQEYNNWTKRLGVWITNLESQETNQQLAQREVDRSGIDKKKDSLCSSYHLCVEYHHLNKVVSEPIREGLISEIAPRRRLCLWRLPLQTCGGFFDSEI